MHLNKLIVISIAVGCLIPIGSSKIAEKQDEELLNPIVITDFIFVKGEVTNLTEHKCGYSTPWYTVECVDVSCILSVRDRPIIQHLTSNEVIEFSVISRLIYGGSYGESSIFMWKRPLFPLYLFLFYFI